MKSIKLTHLKVTEFNMADVLAKSEKIVKLL